MSQNIHVQIIKQALGKSYIKVPIITCYSTRSIKRKMQGILYEASFRVTKVHDCAKEYDDVSKVEMDTQDGVCAELDVHNKLYPQILNVGATTELTLCTEFKFAETLQISASDKAYNARITENMEKHISNVDYVMHGTAFEFDAQNDGNIKMLISFGGLLLSIKEKPEKLSKFKQNQKVYLVMCCTQ